MEKYKNFSNFQEVKGFLGIMTETDFYKSKDPKFCSGNYGGITISMPADLFPKIREAKNLVLMDLLPGSSRYFVFQPKVGEHLGRI